MGNRSIKNEVPYEVQLFSNLTKSIGRLDKVENFLICSKELVKTCEEIQVALVQLNIDTQKFYDRILPYLEEWEKQKQERINKLF